MEGMTASPLDLHRQGSHPTLKVSWAGNLMTETAQGQFEAVHVCRGCSTAIERKQVNPESLISGLIACPHCGVESPLNLEIRGTGEKRPPARDKTLKQ